MSRLAQISAEDLHRRLEEGREALIIDVRSPEEYRTLHAAGAIALPLDQVDSNTVAARLGEAGHAAEAPLYFICHSGQRAAEACERVLGQFPGAAVVEGGTLAWAQAGLPVHQGDQP